MHVASSFLFFLFCFRLFFLVLRFVLHSYDSHIIFACDSYRFLSLICMLYSLVRDGCLQPLTALIYALFSELLKTERRVLAHVDSDTD